MSVFTEKHVVIPMFHLQVILVHVECTRSIVSCPEEFYQLLSHPFGDVSVSQHIGSLQWVVVLILKGHSRWPSWKMLILRSEIKTLSELWMAYDDNLIVEIKSYILFQESKVYTGCCGRADRSIEPKLWCFYSAECGFEFRSWHFVLKRNTYPLLKLPSVET